MSEAAAVAAAAEERVFINNEFSLLQAQCKSVAKMKFCAFSIRIQKAISWKVKKHNLEI